MFIITKTFTDDEGHLFTKVNPKQYSTPEEAYDAMREDYLNELKSRGLEDNGGSNEDGESCPGGYIIGDNALHEIVTKFPDMFVYADEDRIALRSEWQHDDKKLPMAYFDFGYSAADIKQLCAAAKKHCTTQNEQLPSCADRVE